MFGLSFRGELPNVVERELDRISSRFRQLWLAEHNEDGTHVTLPKVHVYTPTIQDVENTTTETVVVTAAILKTIAIGDQVIVNLLYKVKNNKGTSGTLGIDVLYGGVEADLASATLDNSATEGFQALTVLLLRNGPNLYVGIPYVPGLTNSADWVNVFATELVSPKITAGETLSLKVTLSAADASFYMKPQAATVIHTQA